MDNAANNNTMIRELQNLLANFDGDASRTRCFAHILNLVAKTLLSQFDLKKKKSKKNNSGGTQQDPTEFDLDSLAVELEEAEALALGLDESLGEGLSSESKDDGWVDERDAMSEEQLGEHNAAAWPVKMVLGKVNSCLRAAASPFKTLFCS